MLKNISIILPLHNKAHILENTINQIAQSNIFNKSQIIIVENESTDKSFEVAKYLKNKFENELEIDLLNSKKGKGNAIRRAISKVKYEWVLITGADLPFGLSDVTQALKDDLNKDVYLGSKSHIDSAIERKFSRRLYSNIFYSLRKIVLNLNYKDTHGSIFLKSTLLKEISSNLKQEGFFIDTEIVYLLEKNNSKIVEIPIIMTNDDQLTTVKPFRDGMQMFVETLRLLKDN